MMFEHSFGMNKAADLIDSAIEKTLAQGYRTADIAGSNDNVVSTDKLTDLIIENFEQVCNEEAIGVFTL